MSYQDRYSGHAAAYAACRPDYPRALVDFLAELSPRHELAWDCGCGSGQLSVRLAEAFARVVATDASPGQLVSARRHPRVRYVQALAESSGLRAAIVDLAVAAQAAHWFDLAAYYREVRRVARPQAIIALVTYGMVSVGRDVDPIIQRFYTQALQPYWAPERRHVEEGYRSLEFPFDELEAPRLDLRAEWTLAEMLGYIETWSAVRTLENERGGGALQSLFRDLSCVWGAADTARRVRWPLSLRVARL